LGNKKDDRQHWTEDKNTIEKMSDFFAARAEGYDEHMLTVVEGCKEGYSKLAELIPNNTVKILDLGCGTGLELEEIFKRLPDVSVVGIDLTQVMLDKLTQKYPHKNINLICGSYFDIDFGKNIFNAVISFETMHHFSHAEKIRLYTKVRQALKPGGVYLECDYMVTEQAVEDKLFAENVKLRREMNIPDGGYYHFDTPCTIDNQISLFKKSGFSSAEMVWRMANTTLIAAKK
jgi:tRNA (cmo5U34)-methyltransferase